MRLLFDEQKKPSGELKLKNVPHFDKDKNCIIIPIWFIYDLAEKNNVSKKSAFWHVLNHEILHIKKGHHPYLHIDKMKSEQDFQNFANYFRKIERQAIPENIDAEIKKLNNAMRHMIEKDIKYYHNLFQNKIKSHKPEDSR